MEQKEHKKPFIIRLDGKNITYIIRISETGHVENLYCGRKLTEDPILDGLYKKKVVPLRGEVSYDEKAKLTYLETMALEVSTLWKGDFRSPSIIAQYSINGHNNLSTLDFVYESHSIKRGKDDNYQSLPLSYGSEEEVTTLVLNLKDRELPIGLKLYYSVFKDCDVIARRTEIINNIGAKITIQNIASMQLDLPDSNWDVVTFDGAWGRERNVTKRHLENGAIVIDSKNGTSSSYHSSCVYLQRPNCSPLFGEVFAFNLIYSGNHREVIEKSPYGTTRYLTGINPETFSWALKEGETFSTPEAIMTYSFVGTNKVSNNFHKFVNNHITRGYWKFKERPISVSNGNTSGLDFSESKLVSIAKAGRNLGAELFILEDGWFGRRDNDNSSLGDWFVNAKKIPNGITNLSDKIHRTGMLFGLWVEPEMISQNSMLYEKYPDWAVKIPGRDPSIGKNQFILDLTRDDVRRHIIDIMAEAFALGKVDYVRWDMNRVFSDIYSVSLSNMGEFCHRYVLGLYEILNALVREFPKILFEGATSCGNRFDLGLLCFMSQCTASSDSDILSMVKSQEGTSYGYPLAVMGNTIGPSFNPITLRHVSIESAFNVGAFGSLSYNVDFSELNSKERDIIENQIAYYKIHRPLLQYGKFCRICDETSDNRTLWIVSSKDYSEMIVLDFQYLTPMNGNQQVLRIPFANPNSAYLVTARGCEEEHFYVTGDVLSYSGIKLGPQDGTVSGGTRAIGDFGSRLYYISEVDKATIK